MFVVDPTNCPWVSENTSGHESKFYVGVGLGRSNSTVVMIYFKKIKVIRSPRSYGGNETKQTNLTYMIQCKRCKKQEIGETKRTLCVCFKEHRQATNNPLHANTTAAESVPHFNQPGHSIADIEFIPLELQPTLSMSRRKAREAYLIDRIKTLSPDGLNRRTELWTFSISFFLVYLYIILFSIYKCS